MVKFSVDAQTLYRALRAALPFASKDRTREHLQAVRLEAKSLLTVVATDGHTLCQVELGADIAERGECKLLVDSAEILVHHLKSQKGGVTVTASADGVEIGEVRVGVFKDGKYPRWRELIEPKSQPAEAVGFNPRYLERACKAITTFAGKKAVETQGIRQRVCGDTDPQLFEFEEPSTGMIRVVIMPMRL